MKISIQLSCILLFLTSTTLYLAQEWVARYNGPANAYDQARAIVVDNAGNVCVTGGSTGAGTYADFATVKYDPFGFEKWVARYNGPANNGDWANALTVDNDGNVYVTGYSYGIGTYGDYATVKYNAGGVEQWVARYNGPANSADYASAMVVDNAGNIYVTGFSYGSGTDQDYATVKYDSLGVEQWVVRYNGSFDIRDSANAIAIDNAANIYVTGESQFDYATVKYDSSGVEQWVALYDGPANGVDWANAVAVDGAGNIYVTGYSHSVGIYGNFATVKYDAAGVEQWVARYSGPTSLGDKANAIALDSVGNIYVTGYSYGVGTYGDYATVKYNAGGVEQWVARYDGPGSGYDGANAIAVDSGCNVYVTGISYGSDAGYDYATIKYDTTGTELWVVRYDGPANDTDFAYAIAVDRIANVYVTGWSWGSVTGPDYATIKYSSSGIEENKVTAKNEDEITITIFRGPLLLPIGKKCKVFDITGRVVAPDKIQPGIYFIEVDGVVTQKVVKVR